MPTANWSDAVKTPYANCSADSAGNPHWQTTWRNRRFCRHGAVSRRLAGLAIILIASAFLAPYVAQQTLLVADWFTNQLPATGTALLSPIGCVCAALLAWRIARWARNY
jgi:hypothetical protein